jgi:hypothetical protein
VTTRYLVEGAHLTLANSIRTKLLLQLARAMQTCHQQRNSQNISLCSCSAKEAEVSVFFRVSDSNSTLLKPRRRLQFRNKPDYNPTKNKVKVYEQEVSRVDLKRLQQGSCFRILCGSYTSVTCHYATRKKVAVRVPGRSLDFSNDLLLQATAWFCDLLSLSKQNSVALSLQANYTD